jgi:hypothetical protein
MGPNSSNQSSWRETNQERLSILTSLVQQTQRTLSSSSSLFEISCSTSTSQSLASRTSTSSISFELDRKDKRGTRRRVVVEYQKKFNDVTKSSFSSSPQVTGTTNHKSLSR